MKRLVALVAAGLMLVGMGFAPSAAHATAKQSIHTGQLRAIDLL